MGAVELTGGAPREGSLLTPKTSGHRDPSSRNLPQQDPDRIPCAVSKTFSQPGLLP